MDLLNGMADLLTTPFVGELDLEHLFLLVGLVILFIMAWGFILNHIKMAAQEIAS